LKLSQLPGCSFAPFLISVLQGHTNEINGLRTTPNHSTQHDRNTALRALFWVILVRPSRASHDAPDEAGRVGLDGKTYRAPIRQQDPAFSLVNGNSAIMYEHPDMRIEPVDTFRMT